MSVSKELTAKVSGQIEQVALEVFKKHNLVRGKMRSLYGDEFSVKIEGFSNNEISKELAKEISSEIFAQAKKILEENSLDGKKFDSHYGAGFDFVVKADLKTLGKNGVNTSSNYATAFKSCAEWQYGLTSDDLGKEAIINGEKHFLAGIKIGRNNNKFVSLNEKGELAVWNHESIVTRWGGKLLYQDQMDAFNARSAKAVKA
jgi:hypothetical protein